MLQMRICQRLGLFPSLVEEEEPCPLVISSLIRRCLDRMQWDDGALPSELNKMQEFQWGDSVLYQMLTEEEGRC